MKVKHILEGMIRSADELSAVSLRRAVVEIERLESVELDARKALGPHNNDAEPVYLLVAGLVAEAERAQEALCKIKQLCSSPIELGERETIIYAAHQIAESTQSIKEPTT